jgi:hypothetical protein
LHKARAQEHKKYSGSMSPLSITKGQFSGAIPDREAACLRARMERSACTIAGELLYGEQPPAHIFD